MGNITDVMKRIKKNLSTPIFNEMARSTKLVEWTGKYEGHALFWSIIGGFCGKIKPLRGNFISDKR